MTDDPGVAHSHQAGEASGPTRQIIVVILVVAIAALFWFTNPESAVKRCARVAEEATTHQVLETAAAKDPEKPIKVTPPPRPADLAWYAEECQEGKPR